MLSTEYSYEGKYEIKDQGKRIIVFKLINKTVMLFYQNDYIVHTQGYMQPGRGIIKFLSLPIDELELMSKKLDHLRPIDIYKGEYQNPDIPKKFDPLILPFLFLYSQNAHDLLGIRYPQNNSIFNLQLCHKSPQQLQTEFG